MSEARAVVAAIGASLALHAGVAVGVRGLGSWPAPPLSALVVDLVEPVVARPVAPEPPAVPAGRPPRPVPVAPRRSVSRDAREAPAPAPAPAPPPVGPPARPLAVPGRPAPDPEPSVARPPSPPVPPVAPPRPEPRPSPRADARATDPVPAGSPAAEAVPADAAESGAAPFVPVHPAPAALPRAADAVAGDRAAGARAGGAAPGPGPARRRPAGPTAGPATGPPRAAAPAGEAGAGGGEGPARGDDERAAHGAAARPAFAAVPGSTPRGVPLEYEPYVAALRRRIQERLVYPSLAVRRRVQGAVDLEIVLDATGRLVSVASLDGDGPAALREAALRAVREATPFPFPPDLAPRALRIRLPVVFVLR